MIATDRDALTCDMAETYGVFDIRGLPVGLLATLACGLRENSRIKMRMAGVSVETRDLLLAHAVDALNLIFWSKTKGAQTSSNRPRSFVGMMTAPPKNQEREEIVSFRSGAAFDTAWKRLAGGD